MTEDSGRHKDSRTLVLPADSEVVAEAKQHLNNKNDLNLEDLRRCFDNDPILSLELMRAANDVSADSSRRLSTYTRQALVSLGLQEIEQLIDRIAAVSLDLPESCVEWYEHHRQRCIESSAIAAILAEAVNPGLINEARTVGLFPPLGDMLAVATLRDRYVAVAEELSRRGAITYRLVQSYKCDPEQQLIRYLTDSKLPRSMWACLDRDAQPKSKEGLFRKAIHFGAIELLDAFYEERWDRYAPGQTIPPKSHVRLLRLNDTQYESVYEKVTAYLDTGEVDVKEASVDEGAVEAVRIETAGIDQVAESELDGSLPPTDEASPITVAEQEEEYQIPDDFSVEDLDALDPEGEQHAPEDQEDLEVQGVAPPTMTAPPQNNSRPTANKVRRFVSSMCDVFEAAETSEELLTTVLERLTDEGPFTKAALMVMSTDNSQATIVAARGSNIAHGQIIAIDDPLSPFGQSISKVQSFGKSDNKVSPFGSKSFAVAPVLAKHETPVTLYADCGKDLVITFEARRIFRSVVDLLNHILPQLPGGLPLDTVEEAE